MILNSVGFVIVCAFITIGVIEGFENQSTWTETTKSITEKQNTKLWEEDIINGLQPCSVIKNKVSRVSEVITSPNFEENKPFPVNCYMQWEKQVEDGYSVEVTIEKLDLDGQNDNVLYFRGGTKTKAEGKGQVLSWQQENVKFIIHQTNKLYVLFVVKNTVQNHVFKGFKLRFERHGELTTTAAPTTTTQALPTSAPGGQRPEIVVNLTNITPAGFNANLDKFRISLVDYTKKFCQKNNVKPLNPLTLNNVIVPIITYCPRYWPNNDNCVQVTFSIPIELQPSKNKAAKKYELSEKNLEKLWSEYSKTELGKLAINVYDIPNDSYYLNWWMGVTLATLAVVLIAFLVILYCIWKTSIAKDYSSISSKSSSIQSNYRSPGEIDLGLDPNAKRPSTSSLYAEPHQVVPDIFGNDYEARGRNENFNYEYHQYSEHPSASFGSRTSDETGSAKSIDHQYHNEGYEAEQGVNSKPRMNIPSKASAEIPENYLESIKSSAMRLSGGIHDESKI